MDKTIVEIKIVHRKCGIYDVYCGPTHVISRVSADNILSWLSSQIHPLKIIFEDEEVEEVIKNG